MSIDTTHPQYAEASLDWQLMRDCYAGQRIIKMRSVTYLPATGGMVLDGVLRNAEPGRSSYLNYLNRAVFPEAVDSAMKILLGVLHRKPAKIELPPQLEPMNDIATRSGETLLGLLRKINEQQLLVGRVALLADTAPGRTTPHAVLYRAEELINWDTENPDAFGLDRLELAVLREVIPRRSGMFEWDDVTRYRVLTITPEFEKGLPVTAPIYHTFTAEDDVSVDSAPVIIPTFQGRPLAEIPLVVVGANDLTFVPDQIPMLELARQALAVYRAEADYRQTLHMLAQDTLVTIGEEMNEDGVLQPLRVGAGARISLPAAPGADAKYIGINRDGLSEQRLALQSDYTRMREMGARLLEPRAGVAESGEALKVRLSAQTSSLYQLAITGAAGLESFLKVCARWVGADENAVSVTANLDFAETDAKSAELRDLMDAREKGAPLSMESIHTWAKQNGFTESEFDAEVGMIKAEKELMTMLKPAGPPSGVPNEEGTPPAE